MPLADKAITMKMPMIEAGVGASSKPRVPARRCRDHAYRQGDAVHEAAVPEAKIIRGDVAAWSNAMFTEFEKLIDFSEVDRG